MLEMLQQIVEGLDEDRQALHFQPVGHCLEVDAEPRQRLYLPLGLGDVLFQGRGDAAVLPKRLIGRRRHGGHRLRADQGLHAAARGGALGKIVVFAQDDGKPAADRITRSAGTVHPTANDH